MMHAVLMIPVFSWANNIFIRGPLRITDQLINFVKFSFRKSFYFTSKSILTFTGKIHSRIQKMMMMMMTMMMMTTTMLLTKRKQNIL